MPEQQAAAGWFSAGVSILAVGRTQWRRILLFVLCGGLAAGVTALVLPAYYRSGAAFQAEAGTSVPLTGAIAGLASQLGGMQLNVQSNPQLLGDLLTTDALLGRVASARFVWKDDTIPLYAIYKYESKPPRRRLYDAVRRLRNAISVDVNLRTGVVRFSVQGRSPELAKAIADTLLGALNEANIALRQARASAERGFTADRAEQARTDLEVAERNLATFYTRNRVIAGSPALQMEEATLRRAADMAQQVYIQLRLQEEQAAVQAVRNTPAISVIDPPLTPVKPSRPRRRLAIALGIAIGTLVGFLNAFSRTGHTLRSPET